MMGHLVLYKVLLHLHLLQLLLLLQKHYLLLIRHQLLVAHVFQMQELWVFRVRIDGSFGDGASLDRISHIRWIEVEIGGHLSVVKAARLEKCLTVGRWRVVHCHRRQIGPRSETIIISTFHCYRCWQLIELLSYIDSMGWIILVDRGVQDSSLGLGLIIVANGASIRGCV